MSAEPAERRRALVVANARYDDEGLDGLASPARDATALTEVLADPTRCGFDVAAIVDGDASAVIEAVEGFLSDVERSDLLLLYFSCHGLKDEQGRLYLASRNTRRNRLRSTAVSAAVVNDLLLGSRSRRKVLLLDCCYGGAFAKGMQVKADAAVHTADQFDARGLVVVTASDSTQYAFDGDDLRGTVTPSRFTAVLVDGLASGEADVDRDGFVTVDDAYDFVSRRLADDGVPQSPRKWEFDVSGHIVLARTEAAPASLAAPPPRAVAPRPVAAAARVPPAAWWLSALGVVAASLLSTWLLAVWLKEFVDTWIDSDYTPSSYSLPVILGLAVAWGLLYVGVAFLSGRNPWRPPADAYRDLSRPRRIGMFARGLSSAAPVNVMLTVVASLIAAWLGYKWANGSNGRDDAYRLTFAVLALAGIARYLTWAGRFTRRD
jgi:Caspase domain